MNHLSRSVCFAAVRSEVRVDAVRRGLYYYTSTRTTTTYTAGVFTCPTSVIPRQRMCSTCRRKDQIDGQLNVFVLWRRLMEPLRSGETNCSIMIRCREQDGLRLIRMSIA